MTDNNDSIDDAPIPEVPKKKTNKGGRPKKNLTDEQYNTLIAMIRIQCTQDELCRIWDMDSNTLDRIVKEKSGMGFSELYKKHCDEGKMSLRRLQWRKAQEGNTAMLIWLGVAKSAGRQYGNVDMVG